MLNYNDLENIAKFKRLSLINAEKDYLQDIILFSIYSNVGKELVFKGGTALYKIYKLNRFSEDLDFTLIKKADIEKMTKKLISDLSLINLNSVIKEISEHGNGINVKILINGPLYKGNKETQCFIQLNISLREKTLIEAERISIVPLYKEIPSFDVFIMAEKEILAEKTRAIFTRTKPRDIYDIWFLLTMKNVGFEINLVNKKLLIYKLKFNFNNFKKRILKMKGLWKMDIKNLVIGEIRDFEIIAEEIFKKMEDYL